MTSYHIPPVIEVYSIDNFFIFVKKEHSLWWDKKTSKFYAKIGRILPGGGKPVCLGQCYGIIGKLEIPGIPDPKLLLIRSCSYVGDGTFKIKHISFLQPINAPLVQPPLDAITGPISYPEVPYADDDQKSGLSRTLGAVKNTIKASSQIAASKIINKELKLDKRVLEELGKIFNDTDSFYFSEINDITNSLQRRKLIGKNLPFWKAADDRFFWNKHMMGDILLLGSPFCDKWAIPIIQGYYETLGCRIRSLYDECKLEEVVLTVISRRSRFRAGTRYKRRGVDDSGNCANTVETEQILKYKHHKTSFTQIRGSVPVFWAQAGLKYRPPPTLLRGPLETQVVFNKHFEHLRDIYGPVCAVNLVDQTGKERVIWDAYTNHMLTYNHPSVTYCTFDFHEYCRGMRFDNVDFLVRSLRDILKRMGYFWSDREGVICKQEGVFRVNCIDCLDRTNVVQTAFGKHSLEMQLIKLGLLSPENDLPSVLRIALQQLWANNGDIISRQYAGTNALKGDFTRTGERKISGLMKDGFSSASRYTRAHLCDAYRQAALDIMLGLPPEPIDTLNKITASAMEAASAVTSILPAEAPSTILHVAWAPEAELFNIFYLTSRYYLSRFKDAYRQAAIDVMLGIELTDNVFADKGEDEDAAATVEHVKSLLEDCKKLLITEPTEVLGCWGLIDADPETGDPAETDMDAIVILTKYAYYVAEYDEQVDRVSHYQRVSLRDIIKLEVGISSISTPLSVFKKPAPLCVRIHYRVGVETGFFHTFRSTNFRFFNNVAVQISTPEEVNESLKAICETFLVALEIAALPPVPVIYGKPLARIKSKCLPPDSSCRLGSYLNLGSHMSRNPSESQLTLKSAGTKALSNITQQISKVGKLGQSFRRPNGKLQQSVKPPTFTIEPVEDTEPSPTYSSSSDSPEGKVPEILRSRHWHVPSAGVLMSDAPVTSVNPLPGSSKVPLLHAKTQGAFDVATLNASMKIARNKESNNLPQPSVSGKHISTSTGDMDTKADNIKVPEGLALNLEKRSLSEKNLTLNLSSSQSESALKSIRSNLAQAITSPAAATKDMLSPLTKLAKGVHSLGAHLDPRRPRPEEGGYRLSEAHVEELKRLEDRWSGCETKLIAL